MKVLASSLLLATTRAFVSPTSSRLFAQRAMSSTAIKAKPFAVVVNAEIKEDRIDEFMKLIETNAQETRKEPGCIRFGTYSSLGCNPFRMYLFYD